MKEKEQEKPKWLSKYKGDRQQKAPQENPWGAFYLFYNLELVSGSILPWILHQSTAEE